MDGFSDIESSSSDVGAEVNEVETPDADFGDGDGVNDFDDTYESMNNGDETMEYSQETPENQEPVENINEDTDTAVDEQLNDFDDVDETVDITEVPDTAPAGDNVEQTPSDMTTDENVDDALSDFEDDDESSESDVETITDETDESDTEATTAETGESDTETTTGETGESDSEETADETDESDSEETADEVDTDDMTDETDTEDTADETDESETENAADETDEADTDDTTDETGEADTETTTDETGEADSEETADETDEVNTEDATDETDEADTDDMTDETDTEDTADETDESETENATDETDESDTEDTTDETGEADTETTAAETGESDTETTTDETGEADSEETADETDEANTEDATDETDEADIEPTAAETDESETEDTADETDESDTEDTTDETGEADTETTAAETGESDTKSTMDETGESDTKPTTDETGEADSEDTTDETGEADTETTAAETGESDTETTTDETGEADSKETADETDEANTEDTTDETDEADTESTADEADEVDTDDMTNETDEADTEDTADETDAEDTVDETSTDGVNDAAADGQNGETEASSIDGSYDGNNDGTDSNSDTECDHTEKNAVFENVSYHQGQNDLGALGTCGPTSIANSLNRVTGSTEYTENKVLHNAMDNNLCYKSDNPYSCGGTTTRDVVNIIDNVKNPDDHIHTEVYEYDKALSVEDLANRLDDPGTVAMVGVDSATLWDQRGDVVCSGLFQHTDSPSDHWITVDSPIRDEDGNLTGFNVIDSGGGVSEASREKFEAMYMGDASHTVSDPTAVIISNNGDAGSTYTAPEGLERASNYKESAEVSDGNDPPHEVGKIILSNTEKTASGLELSPEQAEVNQYFRGDQFSKDNTFESSIEASAKKDLIEANNATTCGLDENLNGSFQDNAKYSSVVSPEKVSQLNELRGDISEVTEDTVMQKVITPEQFADYTKESAPRTDVSGCASKASDVAPYTNNIEQAYETLRLDYEGTVYKDLAENDGDMYVMRFTSDYCPSNTDYPKMDGSEPWNKPPCTGTGFTGSSEHMVPEYTYGRGQEITDGAIYKLDSEGNETMVAFWNHGHFEKID